MAGPSPAHNLNVSPRPDGRLLLRQNLGNVPGDLDLTAAPDDKQCSGPRDRIIYVAADQHTDAGDRAAGHDSARAAPRLNEGGRSRDLQEQRHRGREVNGHESEQACDHYRHCREHNEPGASSPTSQARLGNDQTGRQADCGRHTALGDDRGMYPLLPAGSHPRSLAPRAQAIPRQAPTPPTPILERLNSILQIRRCKQSPHELIVI